MAKLIIEHDDEEIELEDGSPIAEICEALAPDRDL